MEKGTERSSNQNVPGSGERVNQDREVLELWRQFLCMYTEERRVAPL